MSAGARAKGRLGAGLFAAVLAAGAARAAAEDRVVIHGLQDVEFFQTDSGSLLLSKNGGDPAGAGRLRLWIASEFTTGFQGVIVGKAEGGKANSDPDTQASVEQAFLRYVVPGPVHLMIDAGRIVAPMGNFSKRYLSTVNPLIGAPDSYDVAYPEGVMATGKVSFFDYRVGAIDRPLANANYVPESDRAWRPALAMGFTPVIGLRLGAYATRGPYLGHAIAASLPAGDDWRSYEQEIAGLELEFSRGYFELNGDIAFSSYEVPLQSSRSRGQAWFVEPKYTWTPRLFTALRLEKNDYPYIAPVDPTYWIAQNVTFHDAEVGVGWRFTPDLVLKASYRWDRWDVTGAMKSYFPNGYAYGLQLSYAFDVRSWFQGRHTGR